MKNINYLFLVLAILATACSKTTENIESSSDIPVVEAFLSPENEAVVRLTTPASYSADTTSETETAISGISVYLTTAGDSFLLSEIIDSAGYYLDPTGDLEILEGNTYQLEFRYNENEISSHTAVPLKPENFESSESSISVERITGTGGMGPPSMTEIELSWDDPNNDYYLLYIQYMEEEYDTINEVIEIDDAQEMANFCSEPIQNNMYTLRSMQFMFFGEYRLVLCRITEDYAQLYETLSQSSLEGLAEPPSNVINGKGIFTAFNSDTLMIQVVED